MILVGIDVAKDKHDCFIMNSDGEILAKAFTFSNNLEGITLKVLIFFTRKSNPYLNQKIK